MAQNKQLKTKDLQLITKEGLEILKKEYEERTTTLRNDIAGKIDEARRFGDLSENNAYTSAMEEKDFNEARILELETLIQNSQVVESSKSGKVSLGNKVYLQGKQGEVVYKIVGAEESDPTKALISDRSPLGMSLLGKKEGDKVVVSLPSGNMEYTIKKVE